MVTCSGKKKIKSLAKDKILDWSKLRAFADDKLNVTKTTEFDF